MAESESQILAARKDVVNKLINQADFRTALEASLDEPPTNSKDSAIKDGTAAVVLQVLNSIPTDADTVKLVEALSLEDRDTLLKYVYRFMNNCNTSSPLKEINYAVLLKINAKILELEGLSSVMRVLCDRKTL